MTRETLQWLHWLVSSQSVKVSSSDALQQVVMAQQALNEIEAQLNVPEQEVVGAHD